MEKKALQQMRIGLQIIHCKRDAMGKLFKKKLIYEMLLSNNFIY